MLTYERCAGQERLLIALNLTNEPRNLIVPDGTPPAERLLSTLTGIGSDGILAANEGVILRLEAR